MATFKKLFFLPYPAVVAEWANEPIQIQVGLLRRSQVRIPLEDVYMVKIIKTPQKLV